MPQLDQLVQGVIEADSGLRLKQYVQPRQRLRRLSRPRPGLAEPLADLLIQFVEPSRAVNRRDLSGVRSAGVLQRADQGLQGIFLRIHQVLSTVCASASGLRRRLPLFSRRIWTCSATLDKPLMIHNPLIVGSNPTGPTIRKKACGDLAASLLFWSRVTRLFPTGSFTSPARYPALQTAWPRSCRGTSAAAARPGRRRPPCPPRYCVGRGFLPAPRDRPSASAG